MYMQLSSNRFPTTALTTFKAKTTLCRASATIASDVSACFTPHLWSLQQPPTPVSDRTPHTTSQQQQPRKPFMISCMAGVVLVVASSFPRGLGSDNSSWPLTSRQHLLIQHMPKTGGTSFRKMVFRDAARLGKTWCRTPVTSCFLHRQPRDAALAKAAGSVHILAWVPAASATTRRRRSLGIALGRG